jgi:hypothetical protein
VSRLLGKKGPSVATANVKKRSSTDALLDKFTEMATEESKRMTDAEFKRAVKESREVIDRVRASRERKRGTA